MTVRESLESLFAAWRNGDALRAGAHFAADGIYREVRRAPLAGRDAIVAHFTRFFRDGPGFEFDPQDVLVEGERAAVRYRFTIEAPGGPQQHEGCAFVRYANGTIAEWREYEA